MRKTVNKEKAAKYFKNFLIEMGLDIENPNLKETPERVVKMYSNELFSGLYNEPPEIKFFDVENEMSSEGDSDLIIVGPIVVRSTCSHHFLPIEGKAFIGCLADPSKLPGLSKYARIVNHFASMPQLQELMTRQIGEHFLMSLGIEDVAVIIRAKHFCMSHRGIKDNESIMTTSFLHGKFKNSDTVRQEFLSLTKLK